MSRLYHRLQTVAHVLKKRADSRLTEAAGVTTAQAAVLVVVGEHANVTQRLVAKELGITEPAVTGMVDRLLAAGLITRRRRDDDARVRLLVLTEAGREALAVAGQAFSTVNALLVEALGQERLDRLDADLEELLEALGRHP